ncbi:MAG: hypothetical protein JKY60_10145 [Kordiimonadaceae bacterium]|nr:hypothetical protein [Kordiimonadaceae bacterium]
MVDATIDQPESKFDTMTLSKGYWWAFDCDGDEITVQGSSFSGMERVYINDALVFEKRSLRLCSRHTFTHDGHDYELHLSTVSLVKAEIECMLIKNGQIVGVKIIGYYSGRKSSVLKKLALPFGLGGGIGVIAAFVILETKGIFEEISIVEFSLLYGGFIAAVVLAGVLYWRWVKAKERRAKDNTPDVGSQ